MCLACQLAQCLPQTPQTRCDDWKTIAADCTTEYFFTPGCAQAIEALYPDARILITLRHPADFHYSLHYMRIRQCTDVDWQAHWTRYEPPVYSDFSLFLATKGAFLRLHSAHQWSACLAKWLKIFGKNQVKILILEEWSENPLRTIKECYSFIGVKNTQFQARVKPVNAAEKQEAIYPVNWLARQHYRLVLRMKCLAHTAGAKTLANKIRYTHIPKGSYSSSPVPVRERIRKKLDKHFKPEVEAIEEIIGREIPAWHRD